MQVSCAKGQASLYYYFFATKQLMHDQTGGYMAGQKLPGHSLIVAQFHESQCAGSYIASLGGACLHTAAKRALIMLAQSMHVRADYYCLSGTDKPAPYSHNPI